MSTKLYVGNLSFNMTQDQLRDLFAQFGTVTDSVVITDRMSGRSRGFGFVTMETADAAQTAIREVHGKEIEGRTLTVNEARPKEASGGGGFGGGGGGGYRGGGGGGGGGGRDRGDRRRDRY